MPAMTKYLLTQQQLTDLRKGDVLRIIEDCHAVTPIHWDRLAGVHLIVKEVSRHGDYVVVHNTFSGRRNTIMNDGMFSRIEKLDHTPSWMD